MKIVSPLAVVTAVLLTVLVVGCSSGPGKAPDEDMPPDEMPETPAPPAMQVFTGTFEVTPVPTNPLTGTITATITGISQDDTELTDPALAAAIAQLGGAEQTFGYTLEPGLTMSTIVLTGDLLTALMIPEGMVSAIRPGPPNTNPLTALNGIWATPLTDPQTMATTSLELEVIAPAFTLTVATTPPSS